MRSAEVNRPSKRTNEALAVLMRSPAVLDTEPTPARMGLIVVTREVRLLDMGVKRTDWRTDAATTGVASFLRKG